MFYDYCPEERINPIGEWHEFKKVLGEILIEGSWFRDVDEHRIYVCSAILEILESLQYKKIPPAILRRDLQRELSPHYHKIKQEDAQRKLKDIEETLNRANIPNSYFFKSSLDSIGKELNAVNAFNRSFVMKKYHKSPLLCMECQGVDGWAVEGFVRLLAWGGLNTIFFREKRIVGVRGIEDQNKFQQEDTKKALRNFAVLVSLFHDFNQMDKSVKFSYKDKLGKDTVPHFRMKCEGMIIKEVEKLNRLLQDCFLNAGIYQNRDGIFIAISGITDEKKFHRGETQNKLREFVDIKGSSQPSAFSF